MTLRTADEDDDYNNWGTDELCVSAPIITVIDIH